MFADSLMLLFSSMLIMLRLGKGSGSFPKPLSREDEKKYLDLWEQGDTEARDILIEHNLRLVSHIVKKYYTQNVEVDDLISIGTIGLIKGISSYKQDKGVRLATYASRCIENEILMFFRSSKKSANDISLSESIDSDDEGGSLSLMDVVCTEDDILEKLSRHEQRRYVRGVMDKVLNEREKQILTLRYGLDGGAPRPQREAAQKCGISRSYVSRIEKKALEKLRDAMGGNPW